MKFILIALFAVIILTIIVFIFRRKHIRQIGKLEHEKLQIQHKPIFEEMTKMKQLNMTGETEEKFERWRTMWTEVIDVHMPAIDVLLFDAEDAIDRFRYGKATAIEQHIAEEIALSETQMKQIQKELNELVGSEEKNRNEMDLLMEQYRTARKKVLAHQHSYGATVGPLEKELELFTPKFQEYDQLTENGDYLLAREIVISLVHKGESVFSLIEEIPALLTQLQNKIPASIHELRNGMREMEGQSYYIEHLGLTKLLDDIEEQLAIMIEKTTKLDMDTISDETEAINNQVDSFYDALENEVLAKQYVDSHYMKVEDALTSITALATETSVEASFVQKSYRLNEEDAKIPQIALQKLEILNKQFDILSTIIEERTSANSILQEELQLISTELEDIASERESLAKRMENLRNDEHEVRIKLDNLTRRLQDADRSLHKGNIPGIPDEMDARLEEAEEQLYVVTQSLEEVPLNMSIVHSYLENADKAVHEVDERVKELLENVMLIEWIIQYGNRYRTSNPLVHTRLVEAEQSFRQFRYAKALEEAATAVEEAEPGAMKRIEELMQQNA